jgi:ceramide glucosyltransferase
MIPALVRAILYALCGGATAYALLAIVSAREFFRQAPPPEPAAFAPISILKPIRGADENAVENFRTFVNQDYPAFQIVFGALDRDDPGLEAARRVAEAHPEVDVEIAAGGERGEGNPKVANLANLARRARHPLLLVSDSDVRAPRDYLRRIAAAAGEAGVGVVTSPYRSRGRGWGGVLAALGNATEFQPSVFVARKLEGMRFALGAGILLRRDALDAIGGFAAVAPYLAHDLMLGRLPARAGRKVVLALPVLDHELGRVTLAAYARRQIRWNRGIRAARPGGYAGLFVTHSTVLAILLLAATGGSRAGIAVAAAAIAARLAMAWTVGAAALGDPSVRRGIALVPLRDAAAFLLWVAGFFGRSVEWRGERYRIGRGGRIAPGRPR